MDDSHRFFEMPLTRNTVKSPVGQNPHGHNPHGQKPGWSKSPWSQYPWSKARLVKSPIKQTNKHRNFKTNLFDIYVHIFVIR